MPDDVARRCRSGEREGAHDEQVVAVVAFEAQRGLVAVDRERVVAAAALGDQGRVVPRLSQPRVVATVAKSNTSRRGEVGAVGAALRRDAVDLADLELVVAGAAVEGGGCAVVVDREVVVAAQANDDQPAVDRRRS